MPYNPTTDPPDQVHHDIIVDGTFRARCRMFVDEHDALRAEFDLTDGVNLNSKEIRLPKPPGSNRMKPFLN